MFYLNVCGEVELSFCSKKEAAVCQVKKSESTQVKVAGKYQNQTLRCVNSLHVIFECIVSILVRPS